MLPIAVDWAEVTAIATAILALSLLGAFGAVIFAAQQVREERKSREAQMAAEFFVIERWETWGPALHQVHGPGVYPLFEGLVGKLRQALDGPAAIARDVEPRRRA